MKEVFVFFQFNGDNRCYCQIHCSECYGRNIRTYKHYWNGDVKGWEEAFMRLQRPIYFNFSYGEPLLSHGFFECVEMIGRHKDWTLNIITNLLAPTEIVEKLVNTKLAKDGRLFMNPCWHPEGVDNPEESWDLFRKHLLMLKAADVPTHVMMVWFPPVIKDFPRYFEWLDANDFRVGIRRFVTEDHPRLAHYLRRVFPKQFAGKYSLMKYTEAQRGFLEAYTCPKVTKYGLELQSTYGRFCNAGKDMILVEYDGTVKPCASACGSNDVIGNIFDKDFTLSHWCMRCPTNNCGGDFGMLVLPDNEFGMLPDNMAKDTFLSMIEEVLQSHPVKYPRRELMLIWLEKLKCENSQS